MPFTEEDMRALIQAARDRIRRSRARLGKSADLLDSSRDQPLFYRDARTDASPPSGAALTPLAPTEQVAVPEQESARAPEREPHIWLRVGSS